MTNDTTGEGNLACLLAIAEVEALKLEDENDKLRELVWDMWFYITEPPSLVERFAKFDDINDRMHELGWRGY